MPTPDQIKLIIIAAAAAIALAAAGTAGWWINGWRLGQEITRLQGVVDTQVQSLATLKGANERCTVAVAGVQKAVQDYVDAGDARSAAALAAMQAVAGEAAGHLAAAKGALARPPAALGKECDVAAAEAAAYAKKRKAAP